MEKEPELSIPDDQRARLITVLEELESHIIRQNSLKYTLARGVIYGLGTVIGATVLVALFGGAIATVVNSLIDQPILNESLQIDEL